MAGDYTRMTFDPRRDYSGVLQQQGRVQVDADFNELWGIVDRRLRTALRDIVGRCGVPRSTPNGFRIRLDGSGRIRIGRGRAYVDGIQVENRGNPPRRIEPVWGEIQGSRAVPYEDQPYFPEPPDLPAGGPHFVYLDVWEREVTAVDDPSLVDSAVGVDTTTRVQSVWQVKILPDIGDNVTCETDPDDIPGWNDATAPSAGRLTTSAIAPEAPEDPCTLPPQGGYRGRENRLYRVEIHDDGVASGTPTFKWSRDNAAIATRVESIQDTGGEPVLGVERIGRDPVLRFTEGDWVEVLDDAIELAGEPGILVKVKTVFTASNEIQLLAPPAGDLADIQLDLNPRVRRWDHHGPGLVEGAVEVPATGVVDLEDGVQVEFDLRPDTGNFRVGDYWVFAARTDDASVEELDAAPPRGIRHHYCRLAVLAGDAIEDCRVLYPPEAPDVGEGCDCAVCVTAESHNSGELTIQEAVDSVKIEGGKVCLGPGVYLITEPIVLQDARSVQIHGVGFLTELDSQLTAPVITFQNCNDVTMDCLQVRHSSSSNGRELLVAQRASVLVHGCDDFRLEGCHVFHVGDADTVAVALKGVGNDISISENMFVAGYGISTENNEAFVASGVSIIGNTMRCGRRGISLSPTVYFAAANQIFANDIRRATDGAILVAGDLVRKTEAFVPVGSIDIVSNFVLPESPDVPREDTTTAGSGIIVATNEARVTTNHIVGLSPGLGDGIDLRYEGSFSGSYQVIGNRINQVPGFGIVLRGDNLGSAVIKQNTIRATGLGGIVMEPWSAAQHVCVANNQVIDIAEGANDEELYVAGIRLWNVPHSVIDGNLVTRIGQGAVDVDESGDTILINFAGLVGIQTVSCASIAVSHNEVSNIGPPESRFISQDKAAGIDVRGSFDRLRISDNDVRRGDVIGEPDGRSDWFALRILRSRPQDMGDVPQGDEAATVCANSLVSHGRSPTVQIGQAEQAIWSVTFAENKCARARGVRVTTEVWATSAILTSNKIEGPVAPSFSLRLDGPTNLFTVVGNIASGPAEVNGGPLPPQWTQLNVGL